MNALISSLPSFLTAWSSGLVRASIEGAVAVAIVWTIARYCQFISPRVICWLWRLVCVKFLIAACWSQPVSLAILPSNAAAPAPSLLTVAATPLIDSTANAAIPIVDNPRSVQPTLAPETRFPLSAILFLAWSIGVLCFIAVSVRQWLSLRRMFHVATPADPALQQACVNEAAALKIRRIPALLLSSTIEGPLLTGIIRPVMILPVQIESAFDPSEVRLMLTHEMAHLKRHDLAWNWLPTLVGWLFFFHPLVWLLRHGWFQSQESACDELLIQRHATLPSQYGRLLLKLSAAASHSPRPTLAAVGVLGAYHQLERRILAMTRVKTFSRRRLLAAAGIVSIVAALSLIPWRLVAQESNSDGPAKPASTTTAGYDLSHVVHFKLGQSQFPQGDSITIQEIHGTADNITAGNLYEVKGTYTLNSADKATLAAFTTVSANDPQNKQFEHVPTQKTQTVTVEKGHGKFTLLFYMWQNGAPHVSFYPAGGGGDIGGVYFETDTSNKADQKNAPAPANSSDAKEKTGAADLADKSTHPTIIIAEHVLLWEGKEIVTWEEAVARLKKLRAAGPVHPNFYMTAASVRQEGNWQSWHQQIMDQYRELFQPAGVTFGSVSPRGSPRYDAIQTAADLVPNPTLARHGQLLDAAGQPVIGAQVFTLPIGKMNGPYLNTGVYLQDGHLRDLFDEDWTATDDQGNFTIYPSDKEFYIAAIHPTGFVMQRQTSGEAAANIQLHMQPWATVRFSSTGEIDSQSADVIAIPTGADSDWPNVDIYSIKTAGQPVEVKVPAGKITVARSLAMGKGTSISLPVENFSLDPNQQRTLELKPPSEEDLKRAKEIYDPLITK
jgi:beta-lactamase regulating signal transducer with metallopeptidase domain